MVFRVLAGQAPASSALTYGVQVFGVLLFIFQGTSGEVVSIAPVLHDLCLAARLQESGATPDKLEHASQKNREIVFLATASTYFHTKNVNLEVPSEGIEHF